MVKFFKSVFDFEWSEGKNEDIIAKPIDAHQQLVLNEEKEKVFIANFSYSYCLLIKMDNLYGFGDSYVLPVGQNATFFRVKEENTWYMTF